MLLRDLDSLLQALLHREKGRPWPVCALFSKEELLRKSALDQLLQLRSRQGLSVRYRLLKGENCTTSLLADLLDQSALWQQSELLLIEGVASLSSAVVSYLDGYLARASDRHRAAGADLLLLGDQLPAKAPLASRLEASAFLLQLADLKPWEREKLYQQWIISFFQKEGIRCSSSLAQRLFLACGSDYALLGQECEKLALAVDDTKAELTSPMLDQLLLSSCTATPSWQLGEALMRKESRRAIELFLEALALEASFLGLLVQLRRQVQRQLIVSDLVAAQASAEQFSSRLSSMKGYALQKSVELARFVDSRWLFELLSRIDQLEWQLKDGSSHVEEKLLAFQLLF